MFYVGVVGATWHPTKGFHSVVWRLIERLEGGANIAEGKHISQPVPIAQAAQEEKNYAVEPSTIALLRCCCGTVVVSTQE